MESKCIFYLYIHFFNTHSPTTFLIFFKIIYYFQIKHITFISFCFPNPERERERERKADQLLASRTIDARPCIAPLPPVLASPLHHQGQIGILIWCPSCNPFQLNPFLFRITSPFSSFFLPSFSY